MNPGLISPKGRTPAGWRTVCVDVVHPDHPDVTGDLCRHPDGRYQLLEWNPTAENYTPYAVPHAWAVRQDPTLTPEGASVRPIKGAGRTPADGDADRLDAPRPA